MEPFSTTRSRHNWSPWLFLALIVILGAVLRLAQLGRHSFWLDEILTVQLSVGRGYAHLDFPQDQLVRAPGDLFTLNDAPPAWRIWASLDRDVHPPLFYFVLRAWRTIFGDGDRAIRMLPVALSLAAIIMLYLAAAPLVGRAPALWACLLMALAGPQIEYAQETRSYMLLLVALLGMAAAIARIEKSGPTMLRCGALAMSALAAMLTHYAAAPALAAFALYVLFRLRGRARRDAALALTCAGIAFAVAWGPFWLRQMRGFSERIAFTAADSGAGSAFETLCAGAELPLRFFTQSAIRPAWAGLPAAALYLLPALLLRRRSDLLLWWLWLVTYVGTILAIDLARGAHTLQWTRYTLAASPPAYVLVAAMLAHQRGWRRHVVPAAIAIAGVAALPAAYVRWKADWRDLAEFIESRVTPSDVMIFESSGAGDWQARCAYLCIHYYLRTPGLAVEFASEPVTLDAPTTAWLFSSRQNVNAGRLLPSWRIAEITYVPSAGMIARLAPPLQ